MKFLALLFLAGLALAAAIPLSFHENALDLPVEDFDEYHFLADDDVSEIGKKLKDRLDEVLEKIKEAIENGKGLREDYIEKAKEIRQKLKDLKIDLGDRAKDLIEKLKEKAKDYWQKILDRLRPQESTLHSDTKTELQNRLVEALEKIKEEWDNREINTNIELPYIEKLDDLVDKMSKLGVEVGDKAWKLVNVLKVKASNDWRSALDAFFPSKQAGDFGIYDWNVSRSVQAGDFGIYDWNVSFADEDTKTELQNSLVEALEKIKEEWDNREINNNSDLDHIEKLDDLVDKMSKLGVEVGDKAWKLVNVLKVKASNEWRSVLDALFPSKQAGDFGIYDWNVKLADDNGKSGLGKKLEEQLHQIMEKIKEALDNGELGRENIMEKFKEIRQKLRDLKIDLSERTKELMRELKEKHKEYLKNLLDRLGLQDSTLAADDGYSTQFLDHWIDRVLGDKETRSIKEVYEKIKNYFKELNIELKEKFVKFGEWAKEQYEKGLEKGKTKAENIKKIADEFIKDSKRVSKEVAEEALEFFREYKEDLGRVFDDIKEKVREVVKKDN